MPNTPKILIVDIGFLLLTKQRILINECTLTDTLTGTTQTYHIACGKRTLESAKKDSFSQLVYNRDNFHKIPFEYGCVKFTEFCRVLNYEVAKFDVVLVKGTQKRAFLNCVIVDKTKQIHEMNDLGCPSLTNLIRDNRQCSQTSCLFHENKFQCCTAFKAVLLEKWVKSNRLCLNYFFNRLRNKAVCIAW
jgi:hypothetical protein